MTGVPAILHTVHNTYTSIFSFQVFQFSLAVQEKYLPPSVHVFLRKKKSRKLGHAHDKTAKSVGQHEGTGEPVVSNNSCVVHTSNESEDGHENPNGSIFAVKHATTDHYHHI
jgi:hypothetical protein